MDQPPDQAPRTAASPATPRTRLSPKKLLLSKWTAVVPSHKEKHFLVIRVVEPEPPVTRLELVELQAVHTQRAFLLPWRDLTDSSQWRRGWL